jgi:DhnA family fructose-bisphosphate aldolase class Ia
MFGLEKNVKRLFGNGGKLFIAAFDHPQIFGVMDGLKDVKKLVSTLSDTRLDGFILNPGIFPLLDNDIMYNKKMVMRGSLGGSRFSNFSDCHTVFISPETVLRSGADAVLIMLVLGGNNDVESMTEISKAADAFHQYSIPVIIEVICADFSKTNDTDFVRDGSRIAAEIGADVVKAFYCENFHEVIEGCPVPVILAGGPKGGDIVQTAKTVVDAGVKGFAFGRNIFQSPEPAKLISELNAVLMR